MATIVSTGGGSAPAEARPVLLASASASRRPSVSGKGGAAQPATPAAEAHAVAEAAALVYLSRAQTAPRPPAATHAAAPLTDTAMQLENRKLELLLETKKIEREAKKADNEAKRLELELAKFQQSQTASANVGAPAAPYRTPATAFFGGGGGGGHSDTPLDLSPEAGASGDAGSSRSAAPTAWAGPFASPVLMPSLTHKGGAHTHEVVVPSLTHKGGAHTHEVVVPAWAGPSASPVLRPSLKHKGGAQTHEVVVHKTATATQVAASTTPSQKGAEKEEGPPAPAEPRHSLHQPLAPAEQAEPLEPLGPPAETSPPASEPATGAGLEPVTSAGLEPGTTSHEPAAAAEEHGPELSRIFVQMPVDCGATMCSNLDCSSYGRTGRCCGCYTTTYCSKNCQELHWPTHRGECQAEQRRSLAHDREVGLAQRTDPSGHVYCGRVVPDGSSPPDASMWLLPPIGMWRALEPEASPEPEPPNIEWARPPGSRTAIFDLIMSECSPIGRDFADAAKPHFFDTVQPVSSLFIQEHDENRTAQREHPRAFETVFALDPAEPVLIQTEASSTLSGATWANDAQWHSSAVFRPYQALHGEPWRPGGITIPTGVSEPRFITGRL